MADDIPMFSSEDVSKLLAHPTPTPGTQLPPATPEILRRTQVIVDDMKKGASRVQHVTGEAAREAESGASSVTDIPVEDKLRFMSHVLGGQEFTKSYTVFGGRGVLEYTTVPPLHDELVGTVIRQDMASGVCHPTTRKRQYHTYLLPLSIVSMTVDDVVSHPGITADTTTAEAFREAYRVWMGSITGAQHQLLFDTYLTFVHTTSTLMEGVHHADFWPTP